jgi:hypothetical protein
MDGVADENAPWGHQTQADRAARPMPIPSPSPQGARGTWERAKPRRPRRLVVVVGTISRKTSESTEKFNGQNLLDIAVTNALELARGQNFEN